MRRVKLTAIAAACALAVSGLCVLYYVIVLGLDIVPYHTGNPLFRPLVSLAKAESRVLYPVMSAMGARDILVTAVIVGVPTLFVVGLMRRRYPTEAMMALAFTLPSLLFFIFIWPVQGIAVEMDLVLAAFPTIFPLLWVCARSEKATIAAACLLAAGHGVFWFVVLGETFINPRIG